MNTVVAKELRCWRCERPLAELVTPPYCIACSVCHARNAAGEWVTVSVATISTAADWNRFTELILGRWKNKAAVQEALGALAKEQSNAANVDSPPSDEPIVVT